MPEPADPAPSPHPIRRFFGVFGPGVVTGASDDDPSGISTNTVAGASLGYATLWTALFTFPLMFAVQFISAKVGLVSGRGFAGVLRHHYPRAVLYPAVFALVAANTMVLSGVGRAAKYQASASERTM